MIIRRRMLTSTVTRSGLATVNLQTRAIEPVVEGRAGQVVVGKKSREVYYTKGNVIYATHLDTTGEAITADVYRTIREVWSGYVRDLGGREPAS